MPYSFLKKAQLQVQETILVVFVFILILIIGAGLFIRYQGQSIQEENKAYQREQFNLIITTLPQLAELKCSQLEEKKACLDTYQLTAFSILDKNLFKELGLKTITVSTTYPTANSKLCTSKTLDDCGVWQLYSKKPPSIQSTIKAVTPISLYNPITQEYSIGILTVEAYDL